MPPPPDPIVPPATPNKPGSLHKTTNKPIGRNRRRNRNRRKSVAKQKATRISWPHVVHSHISSDNVCKQATATESTIDGQQQQGSTSAAKATAMWESAFVNAIRWQTAYRTEYWRQLAARRKLENQQLRQRLRQLQEQQVVQAPVPAPAAAEIGEQADGEFADEVDEQYLQFVEISMRHQMQRQRERELEESQTD